MNKKPVRIAIGLGVFLLLGFICLPHLISKNYIISQVTGSFKVLTGQDLDIQGDMEVGSFPRPHVIIHSLDVHNLPGAASPFMLVIKSLDVRPTFLSLLTGGFNIDTVAADGVELRLERFDDNHANWQVPSTSNNLVQSPSTTPQISSLTITNGTLRYTNTSTKYTSEITGIGLNLLNKSGGDSTIKMSLHYVDRSINVQGTIGNISQAIAARSLPMHLVANSEKTKMSYEGEMGLKETNLYVKGNVSLDADDVAPWINLLTKTPEQIATNASAKLQTLPLPVQLTTDITTDADKISLSNIALSGSTISGKAEVVITQLTQIDLKAKIDTLNLESISQSKLFDARKAPVSETKTDDTSDPVFERPKPILGPVALSSDIAISDIIYNNQHIKDTHLAFDIKDEDMAISRADTLFPGESRIVFVGFGKQGYEGFELDGQIESAGNDFMQLVSVFKTKGFAIPTNDFKRFRFRTNAVISTHDMRFSEIAARIEDIAFVGGMVVTLGEKPEVRTSLNIFGLNLDHFITLWGLQAWQEAMLRDTLIPQTEALLPQWLKHFGYDLKLNAALEKYVLDGKVLDKSDLSLKASEGKISLSNFKTTYNGSEFVGDIAVNVQEAAPHIDLDITADTIDLDTLLGRIKNPSSGSEPAKEKTADRLSTEGFNFHWLDVMNGTYHFKIGHFKDDIFEVYNVDAKGTLIDGKMSADEILFNFLGSAFGGKGTLKGGRIPSATFEGWLRGLEVGNLYGYLPALQGLTGKFNVTFQLNTSGNNILTWVNNLWGAVGVGGRDLIIRGLNMPGITHAVAYVRNVADILNVVKRAFPGGNSAFSTVEGQWTVANGKIKLSNTILQSDDTKGTLDGDVDLINWKIESQVAFDLKSLDVKRPPSVMVNIIGGLDNPEKTLDTHLLEQYVTDKTSENMLNKYGTH